VPNRDRLMATAAIYAGLFYQVFGETYCEFSPGVGPLLTPAEMLERSDQWFSRALGHVQQTGDFSILSTQSVRQLAHLGRARARLALGDQAGAAQDAAVVQPGFVAWVTRDASVRGRWNATFRGLNVMQWRTIAGPVTWSINGELVSTGYYNLTIAPDGRQTVGEGVPDPRVPVRFIGQFAQDGVTDQWNQFKYTSLADNQHLARWAEAQLILAEVEGGQSAVNRINALRDVHGLPHYRGGSAADIQKTIIEERRREFFLEGRHYADKLRFGLWFPRGQGFDRKSEAYGLSYCMLMPMAEYENNRNIPAGYEGPDLSNPSYRFVLR
jgi:hypothetical protein